MDSYQNQWNSVQRLMPSQCGFRPAFQAAELVQSLLRVLKHRYEWQQSVSLTKTDPQRAFDSIYHSAIYATLQESKMLVRLQFLLARELCNSPTQATVYDMMTPCAAPWLRGVRQEAGFSALPFNATLTKTLKICEENWNAEGRGIQFGKFPVSNLSFPDDICCVAKSRAEATAMQRDLRDQLLPPLDLKFNPDKHQCLSEPPLPIILLPGKDCNAAGVTVLRRQIRLARKYGLPYRQETQHCHIGKFWALSLSCARAAIFKAGSRFSTPLCQSLLWCIRA